MQVIRIDKAKDGILSLRLNQAVKGNIKVCHVQMRTSASFQPVVADASHPFVSPTTVGVDRIVRRATRLRNDGITPALSAL